VALNCAKRDDMILSGAGLHIVELAEANSRFSELMSGKDQ
jgi:hypothetical protein